MKMFLLVLLVQFTQPNYYHKLNNTRELVTTQWTHVDVPGIILRVSNEADGDIHMLVSDGSVKACHTPDFTSGACVIAEIRPGTTLATPAIGSHVHIRGVSRFDKEHKWYEIHPVDSIQ